jgi:L-histidine N-alpha-methyltransferase
MRLLAGAALRVRVPTLGLTVDFAAGEDLRTEISAKFEPDGVRDELADAGFETVRRWSDDYGRFLVTLARAS